jgi:trehalose utilization protein
MLDATDVLLWWGHAAHDAVSDDVVSRVVERVWAGMGWWSCTGA